MRVELEKYTYLFEENTGLATVLRNGLPWRDCQGDNFILAMAQRIEELEAESIVDE